jgi:hypothetical protein
MFSPTDDRGRMARHLRLALVALAAGCVNLDFPVVVVSDGSLGAPDGSVVGDVPRDQPGTPGPDTLLPDAPDARIDAPGLEGGGGTPDTRPPDLSPDTPDPPAPLANGASCSGASVCQSGICSEGVCCAEACTQLCRSCKIPGSLGACIAVPSVQDPRSECPAEAASTCRRAGGCDGAGACRLHASGTVCVAATCTSGSETPARTCNGSGLCQAAASRACSPYACGTPSCATSCTTVSQCSSGNVCFLATCVPSASVPELYWNFDEASGTTAFDQSGNGLDGVYTGAFGAPDPTTDVPPLMFASPRSRVFSISNREGVRLGNTPSFLQPSNNITVSVWYRATRVDLDNSMNASDLVSAGDNYMFRLDETGVAMVKRTSTGFARCDGRLPTFNPLDGEWHHVAGVVSTGGMRVYIDGDQGCSNPNGESIFYTSGDELWVGRHGDLDTDRDFDGQIDDVRIYTRVLSVSEIQALAAGGR